MKRFVMIMTAAVLMGTTAMAQGNNGQRPQFDRTEMIKQRTDAMVEKYKLDAEVLAWVWAVWAVAVLVVWVAVVAVVRQVRVVKALPRWVAVASR